MPRMVIGIGNPGRAYEGTRHNVGFVVVDRLAERLGVELAKKAFEARYAFHGIGGDQVVLVKPQTYVNLSGEAVRGFCEYYKIAPDESLAVCDDMNLPVGKLRLRRGGSSGGHKGLDSMIRLLGTDAFPRLRIGVGSPPPFMEGADYVLGRPAGEERQQLDEAIGRAADAVSVWLAEGIEAAMNRFNVKDGKDKDKEGEL